MEDVLHPNLIEDIEKLGTLIKDIKIAMMTTIDEKGRMHSRPMMTQQQEFEGDLWFFTSASSHKISEINWNRQVHLIYSSPEKNSFISVSGTAEIVRDHHKIKDLWNTIYQAWFPRGLSDPDLILLKVQVDQAEYWEATSRTAAQVIAFAKTMIDGKRHAHEVSEHKKIDLTG